MTKLPRSELTVVKVNPSAGGGSLLYKSYRMPCAFHLIVLFC